MSRALALVVVLLAAAACGGGDEPEATAEDRGIVYTVNRDGYNEIWVMDEDGDGERRLTESAEGRTNASGSREPSWSPDGTRIAYVGTGDAAAENPADMEIYVMSADGSGKRRLTSNALPDSSPSWSPDGATIAVARPLGWDTEDVRGAIYLLDSEGGGERMLVSDEKRAQPSYIAGIDWSPDGKTVLFDRLTFAAGGPKVSLYAVLARGGSERLLAENGGGAAFSPDGQWIAFSSTRDRLGETCFHECAPSPEVYVMRADGSAVHRLTRDPASDSAPAWSPDGEQLVFVSDRSDRDAHAYELYVADVDRGSPRRLTRNEVWDLDPDWR